MDTSMERYKAALLTAEAIRDSLVNKVSATYACQPPIGRTGSDHWSLRVMTSPGVTYDIQGVGNSVSVDRIVMVGGRSIRIRISEKSGVFDVGIMVCEAILGTTFIPMKSRREVRKVVKAAERDATEYFARGMRAVMEEQVGNDSSLSGWSEWDDTVRWEYLVQSAASVYGEPEGFRKQARKAGVPYDAFNVYDDVFYEEAANLMATCGLQGRQ